jgi:hypothetical protein
MTDREEVRWGPAQRFEFIEWRVYWTGRINRKDIEDEFGVSTPQASLDLKTYQELAPTNIAYDATEKTYLKLPEFKEKFLLLSADRYLRQLDAILNGAIQPADTWFTSPPPASVIPTVLRSVNPIVLQTVLRAIERRQEIDVTYQSLTNTRVRTIAPHSIAFDGHRWHARAWSGEHEEFRDFVLTRILSVEGIRDSSANPTDDVEWNTIFELRLAPHPKLDQAKRAVIAHDFGITTGERPVQIRLALAYYFVSRMNLDLDDEAVSPDRKQLQLVNLTELEPARAAAKAEARRRVEMRSGTGSSAPA